MSLSRAVAGLAADVFMAAAQSHVEARHGVLAAVAALLPAAFLGGVGQGRSVGVFLERALAIGPPRRKGAEIAGNERQEDDDGDRAQGQSRDRDQEDVADVFHVPPCAGRPADTRPPGSAAARAP